jgi:hypothetical protein
MESPIKGLRERNSLGYTSVIDEANVYFGHREVDSPLLLLKNSVLSAKGSMMGIFQKFNSISYLLTFKPTCETELERKAVQ